MIISIQATYTIPPMAIISLVLSVIATLISVAAFVRNAWKDHLHDVRYQADSVSTWISGGANSKVKDDWGRPMDKVMLCNLSNQPVYDVILTSGIQQAGEQFIVHEGPFDGDAQWVRTSVVGVLPPGTFRSYIVPPDRGMCKRSQSVIAFRDVRGVSWVRGANGDLHNLGKNQDIYNAMNRPLPALNVVPIEQVD